MCFVLVIVDVLHERVFCFGVVIFVVLSCLGLFCVVVLCVVCVACLRFFGVYYYD